jgi:Fur family ferric uptake transcriptional regulator
LTAAFCFNFRRKFTGFTTRLQDYALKRHVTACKRFAIRLISEMAGAIFWRKMKPHAHSPHQKRQEMSALTGRLRRQSRKITGPRAAILEILRRHRHPLTNREIFSELPGDRCDLATIYRAMHLLEEMGMVKRFDFGDGAARFELVGENDDGHHHHLVCTQCAEVVEIEECFPEKIEKRIAAQNGFKAVTHKLEFFGICPDCQR